MVSRTKSWRITARGPRILLLVFLLASLLPLSLDAIVDANAAISANEVTCPPNPVCILPGSGNGITLNTKYGQLVPQHNMPFNAIYINANGSIYLDTNGLEPRVLNILRFNLQSYGNGSFDVRFLGTPALSVTCACPMDLHLTTQLPQGPGTEVFFSGNMQSSSLLTVQWTNLGGSCVPFCAPTIIVWGWIIVIVMLFLILALIFTSPKKKQLKKYREDNSVVIGRDDGLS